jgi:hypothetical protein
MRHKAVPAATMIVAAGLIGITQARLPRPIRDYRERVSVEMSTIALLDDTVDCSEAVTTRRTRGVGGPRRRRRGIRIRREIASAVIGG